MYGDESGFAQDMPRLSGYSLVGKRCFGLRNFGEKKRTNVIGALYAVVYATKISSISKRIFYDLLEHQPFLLMIVVIIGLLPSVAAMMPFTVSITASDLKRSIKSINLVPFAHRSIGMLFLNSRSTDDALPFASMTFVETLIFWTVTGY